MRQSLTRAREYLAVLILSVLLSSAMVVPVPRTVEAQQDRSRQLTQEEPKRQNERRIALVVGNGAYTNAPRLKNPPNDATDIAESLSKLGFTVEHGVDLTQKQMKFMIREFGQKLKGGGQGLFYFAGHGVQLRGRNYLIPVDADIQSEADVEDQGVDANLVLGLMDEANNGLNVVILDACRNNPFARSFRSASNGLAQVDAPTGTLIAYATAPGRVARDGMGRNGTYTAELLNQMRVPGLPVEEMLKRVRANVKQQTNGEQVPWESSSLVGDFYFNREKAASSAAKKPMGGKMSAKADLAAVEQEYWEKIKNSTNAEDFRDYLKEYPAGPHAMLARSNLRRMESSTKTNNARASNTSGVSSEDTIPLAKVMNTAFAGDYSGKLVKVLARFVAPGQMENYIFGAIPKKIMEGKVAFRVSSPDQTTGPEVPFGTVLPHVFIDKAQADLVFELKEGDLILLTGSTVVGRLPPSMGQDFIQVIFIATSIEKIRGKP